jgi:hypothetical protein
MGNRGVLHHENRVIVWTRESWRDWIMFSQKFNGRDRTIMKPGNCTELFFFETTSVADGHTNLAVSRKLSETRDVHLPKLISGEVYVQDALKFVEAAA